MTSPVLSHFLANLEAAPPVWSYLPAHLVVELRPFSPRYPPVWSHYTGLTHCFTNAFKTLNMKLREFEL
jgi:hypothetical protein